MKQPLEERVARMASHYGIDVVMLAECETGTDDMLNALNKASGQTYHFPPSRNDKIHIFTRYEPSLLTELYNNPQAGLTVRNLLIGEPPGILLAVVHFPSRVNYDRDDQILEATRLADNIIREENHFGTNRTILFGDLNMNPFDPGLIGAQALHAVMTRQVARKKERKVLGKSYRFFYNPMWSHFGDRTTGPPGTYYHSSSKPANQFWHIYDQILLRPELMDSIEDLQILDSDGVEPLVSKSGLPHKTKASDHLPIFCRLKL